MKKIVVILFLVEIVLSCNKNGVNYKDSELIGKWRLIEVLADPGDGSGIFHTVNSDKIIEFHSDGTVTSNGLICSLSIETNSSSSGAYSLADSTIDSSGCVNSALKLKFIKSGSTLIIMYPCIEACQAKYVKE